MNGKSVDKNAAMLKAGALLQSLRDFALTVGEDCPEGHRRDPASGACLPIGPIDYTEMTRSKNVDDGPEWRGTASLSGSTNNKGTQLPQREDAVDADEMDAPESCADGTTFSFIQRRCLSLDEAEQEDLEGFARDEEGNEVLEDVEAPQEEVESTSPGCPEDQFFDGILNECVPLNKDTVLASEDFSDEFKQAVATYARLAMTSPDPLDGHRHVATLDMDGNGVTSSYGYDHAHNHDVKKFIVQDRTVEGREGESYTSRHLGFAIPEEHRIENLESCEDTESVPMPAPLASETSAPESAAPISTPQRKALPDSIFGVPGKRKFPLDTCARVRNAMARFNQAKGLTSGEKATLRRKILARAKACGIEVKNFGKANTAEEFAAVTQELIVMETKTDTTRLEAYRAEAQGRGPCPPGMNWDAANNRCTKVRGFVEELAAQRDLAPQPEGRPVRLPIDCPEDTIWNADRNECTPLDSSKNTKSSEEEAALPDFIQKMIDKKKGKKGDKKGDKKDDKKKKKAKSDEDEAQTTPNGPGKKKGPGCPEGEFMNPITKKCQPRKGAFKGKSEKEDAENAQPDNREGLTSDPAGRVKLPSDCPAGTVWNAVRRVCSPLSTMDKNRPSGGAGPQNSLNVASLSVAQLIKELDAIIKEQADQEKSKVDARDLPNAAFPPSLVSPTHRSLMHHTPNVEDPYDTASVDVIRLRNSLFRAAAVQTFSDKAVEDGIEHLLFHAREIVVEKAEKKS